MERFEFCICLVEKTNRVDQIWFKHVLRKFDEYTDAINYAEKIKETITQIRDHLPLGSPVLEE